MDRADLPERARPSARPRVLPGGPRSPLLSVDPSRGDLEPARSELRESGPARRGSEQLHVTSLLRRLARRWRGGSADETRRRPRRGRARGPTLELRVREGADRGLVLRIDAASPGERVIGRRSDGRPPAGTLALRDPTVSTRQAVVRREGGAFTLEHVDGARNPTLLNGDPVTRRALRSGDTIRMGAVVLEVTIAAVAPAGSPAEPAGRGRGAGDATLEWEPVRTPAHDDATEILTPDDAPAGHLRLVGGVPALGTRRFALRDGESRIGRAPECEVHLPDRGISRLHAVVQCRGGRLELVHCSGTNITEVNGELLTDRRRLRAGDEIVLSGRVVLLVEIAASRGAPPRRTLVDVMEERARLERAIAEFEHEGSFVDIDVVDSYGMKDGAPHASVVISFERLRAWLWDVADRFEGRFLNSNGDESMFFFPSADAAVDAAVAVLEGLDTFNRERNELESDFRLRIGIHTGRAAVDLQRGYAYSPVLDAAGHLQKSAVGGGLVISGETLAALSRERRFERLGELARHGIVLHRWTGGRDGSPPDAAG